MATASKKLFQENILVSDDEVAQLCDFGLVCLAEWTGSGFTSTSPYGGTIRFKAPELYKSETNKKPKPTRSSDIYSLGCVTYQVGLLCLTHGRATYADLFMIGNLTI